MSSRLAVEDQPVASAEGPAPSAAAAASGSVGVACLLPDDDCVPSMDVGYGANGAQASTSHAHACRALLPLRVFPA